jgi:hypothetical protein
LREIRTEKEELVDQTGIEPRLHECHARSGDWHSDSVSTRFRDRACEAKDADAYTLASCQGAEMNRASAPAATVFGRTNSSAQLLTRGLIEIA